LVEDVLDGDAWREAARRDPLDAVAEQLHPCGGTSAGVVAVGEHIDPQLADDGPWILVKFDPPSTVTERHPVVSVGPEVALDSFDLVEDRTSNVFFKMNDLVRVHSHAVVVSEVDDRAWKDGLRVVTEAGGAGAGRVSR